jgi:tetratricopeptide (TPR) repeat protein
VKGRQRLLLAIVLLIVIGSILPSIGVSLWGEYHYRAARRALDHRDLDEAKRHIEICLGLWPNSGLTHVMAAQACRRTGMFQDAERHLGEANRLLHYSEEMALESTLLAAQQNNNDAIYEKLQAMVDRGHPRKGQILEALAKSYLRFLRYREAETCLKEWLDCAPDNAMAIFMLASTYDQLGRTSEVPDLYARALELAPDGDVIRFNLALSLMNNVGAKEAMRHWEILARRQPDNPDVLFNLACCQRGLGLVEEARSNLDRLLEHGPNSAKVLEERGRLALQSEKPEIAERYLRRAVALDPYNFGASFVFYNCLMCLGREKEAHEQRRRWERLDAELTRLDTIVKELIPASPTNPQLKSEAGVLYMRVGKVRLGLDMLHSALQLDPKNGPALAELKDYYQRSTGDAKAAAGLRDGTEVGGLVDEPPPGSP